MLFSDITMTFKSNTFTKPSRLAALDRLGFYVKTLHFNLPHSAETFLPPLVEPETGAELSFTYTPQTEHPSTRQPKYGDVGTTEILSRQYPPLFHASTNVSAFVRAFSAFVNLTHLSISCPGYDAASRYRRSVVDYALVSLRIAVEKNCLNALDTLTISPIHPGGLMYLSPLLGFGASPKAASKWSRIRHLTVHVNTLNNLTAEREPNHLKLLQTYLHNFQTKLESFNFRWIGDKGPLPIQRTLMSSSSAVGVHPAHAKTGLNETTLRKVSRPLYFPRIKRFEIENVKASASDIGTFVESHRRTVEELNFEDIELTTGTWDDALAPLIKRSRQRIKVETAEIPIMLSPTACSPSYPMPMERVEFPHGGAAGSRKSLRLSKWLSTTKTRTPTAARKVREGLLGCEEQLKKVFRGNVFSWK